MSPSVDRPWAAKSDPSFVGRSSTSRIPGSIRVHQVHPWLNSFPSASMNGEGNRPFKMDRRSRTVGRQWICCGGFTSRSGAWAADTAGKSSMAGPHAGRDRATPDASAVDGNQAAAASIWADRAPAAAGLRSPVAHGQMALRTKSESALQGLP